MNALIVTVLMVCLGVSASIFGAEDNASTAAPAAPQGQDKVETKENTYPRVNCAVSFPAGWTAMKNKQPSCCGRYQSPDGAKQAKLEFIYFTTEQGFTPSWLAQRKAASERSGIKLLSDKPGSYAGHPTHEFVAEQVIDGASHSIFQRWISAGRYIYILTAMSKSGDAASDPTMNKFLNSFRISQATQPVVAVAEADNGSNMLMLGAAAGILILGVGVIILGRKMRAKPAAQSATAPAPEENQKQ